MSRLHARWVARGSRRRDHETRRQTREGDEAQARRSDGPAARQRALGREVLDARHDGHRPQPRSERSEREGSGHGHRGRALRLRLVPSFHRDVRPHRARHRRFALRTSSGGGQDRGRRQKRRRTRAGDPEESVRELSRRGEGPDRQGVPAGSRQATTRGRRGRVQELERRPRHRLSRSREDFARPRHRGERAGDGVRQS
ncbi:unannotated protein [freshwater metagenome]|uniref:Unannotated protein n=1 Tax=freshwater metagenome TaxID=449393 RepID=A0A6J6E6L9_9ZZZZ